MVKLTDRQRRICERVINVFETGTVAGKYGAISIYRDGPNRMRQITYGRSQTTEYGNLRQLVEMYVSAQGKYSTELDPYASKIGQVALVDNATFKELLKKAGDEDPVMRSTQDAFFDKAYFTPARKWADANGFTHALSMLVIYDSFIHSGKILDLLRSRFRELPPAKGGNEKNWILQYVTVRDKWLTEHSNPDVRPSAYRTKDLLREIGLGNWDLSILPINANGTPVDDAGAAGSPVAIKISKPAEPTIEFHGEAELPSDPDLDMDPIARAATETASALASQILASARIKLATVHPSGVSDQANARQNIVDTSAGKSASRSSYGNAPGGSVALDTRLLSAILELAENYTFSISELVGGSHSLTSRHYAGISADFNVIDGIGVTAAHAKVPAFKKLCRTLGATEVLGPGDAGHTTHVHAAWPRVAAGQPEALVGEPAAPKTSHDESVLLKLASDTGVIPAMKRLLEYRNLKRPASNPRYWAVVNFDLHSAKPRLFLFDRVEASAASYLCAHGEGSEGKEDDGYAVIFSNVSGSNCSSLGVFKCAELYDGKHGRSMRLDGLEPSNSKARDRFVVMHGANYVSPEWIAKHGRIGRSDGCTALEISRTREVIEALHGGSLMVLWKTP